MVFCFRMQMCVSVYFGFVQRLRESFRCLFCGVFEKDINFSW